VTTVRWTTPASDHLAGIVSRIQEDNVEAARRVGQSILNSVARLEAFPNIGKHGEKEGIRELVSTPYVIVDRLKEDVAEILYIWHGAQDWRCRSRELSPPQRRGLV
jgi:plasmid stabilization system protein ParE